MSANAAADATLADVAALLDTDVDRVASNVSRQAEQLELTVHLQPSGTELFLTVEPNQSPAALCRAVHGAARAGLHRTAAWTDIIAIRLGDNDLLGGDIHDVTLEDYGVEDSAVLVAEVDEIGIEERFTQHIHNEGWLQKLGCGLGEAVVHNNVEEVTMMLKQDALVAKAAQEVAHAAARFNCAEVLEVLLANGANTAGHCHLETPSYIAARWGCREALQVLVAAKADVNQARFNGVSLLWESAYNGHRGVVDALLAAKADVNQATEDGTSPLWVSAEKGHRGVVDALLAAKADVNQAGKDGTSPLWVSAQNGHGGVVDALIAAKADVNQAREHGVSPLFISSQQGHRGVMAVLLAAKAHVNTPMSVASRHNSLTIAALMGHAEVYALLLQHGADPEYKALPKDDEPFATEGGTAAEIMQAHHGL